MGRSEPLTRSEEYADRRLRLALSHHPEHATESRTIVIRQASGWQSLAFLFLCLLLMAAVLLGHYVLRGIDAERQQAQAAIARAERKIQALEAGIGFDARRRILLLGMRDHILRVNPRIALADAYLYARLALEASEKYPSVDPLLLVAIGTVESGYEPQARSHADARGLYQIWPSTGRLLARSLGWDYEDETLYDPQKNTEAAALYLDILFSAYNDPQMVLAEYNGGPVNAGYYRAEVGALATETKSYVPRVLALYGRLREQLETGALQAEATHRDGQREGKALGARTSALLARAPAAVAARPGAVAARGPTAAGPQAAAPSAPSRP
jgi:soluble lytic murein transglycosylase-like protein